MIEAPAAIPASGQEPTTTHAGDDNHVEHPVHRRDLRRPRRRVGSPPRAAHRTPLSERSDTVTIHGPFAVGTKVSVRPAGADFDVACTIAELVENERYAYQSELNGLLLTSRHLLTELPDGGTRITHYQGIAGPTADTDGPGLGARITEDTPDAMADLIAAATARTQPA